MSVPDADSDLSRDVEPALYLLEMDPTLIRNETQVFPYRILSGGTDVNHARFFLPIQNKEGAGQQQLQVLIDSCQEPAATFINAQVEDYQLNQKQLTTCEIQNQLPISHNLIPKVPDTQEIRTPKINFIPPPINNSEKTLDIDKKLTQNYVHISDRIIPSRAIAVLPNILRILRKNVISPRRTLLPRTRFGPIQGIKQKMSLEETKEMSQSAAISKLPLFVLRDEDECITCIDVTDEDKANWIGLLPLGDESTANVWIYEENHELYIITNETVAPRKQLMLGYSTKYAQEYGLVGPTKDIETGFTLNSKSWWCSECQRTMSSASLLQRHMSTCHQVDKAVTRRRRYRCRHCTRTFSRIFTLRRHITRHCEKKPPKSDKLISAETLPEAILNSSLNNDDNRVPSDESFHNYSNGLDFSTNLFDTDRMPNLDISGSSRSDVFSPYDLVNISHDLEYTNGNPNKLPSTKLNESIQQGKKPESSQITCIYCKQDITKGKKRQHISECPARRFECHCRKVFPSKELLAVHVYSEHSTNKEEEQEQQEDDNSPTNTTIENNKTYVCEQCQHAFKRRGMLVNHLWRVHNTVSARVPFVRRERHFPCGACPKLYRTAAKRSRHVRVHHPGAENISTKEIEGGIRACSPAACSECPRQYATRAKLLQHQRQHHPTMVQTAAKRTNSTDKDNKTSERVTTSAELHKYKASLQQLLSFY